jgi:hemerythrin superfamily protein
VGRRRMNALEILRKDHERVKELFSEYDTLSSGGSRRNEIVRTALRELELHSRVEEDVFYPAMRARTGKMPRNWLETASTNTMKWMTLSAS